MNGPSICRPADAESATLCLMEDERILLRRWGDGDREAAATLLEQCLDPLARFFRGKVQGSVDDLVQETLMRCLARRQSLAPGSSFRAYMFTVARNLLFEQFRRAPRQAALDPEQMSLADLSPTPSAVVGRGREQQLMMAALREIPIESQLLLELYYWEELSVAELADVTGVPMGTVKSRLHRARRLLRAQLETIGRADPKLADTLSRIDQWDQAST